MINIVIYNEDDGEILHKERSSQEFSADCLAILTTSGDFFVIEHPTLTRHVCTPDEFGAMLLELAQTGENKCV